MKSLYYILKMRYIVNKSFRAQYILWSPWLSALDAGRSPLRPRFISKSIHVRFVLDKMYKMTTEMKLYPVEYLGFTAMDKRFTRPMLPWVIAEIKRRGSTEKKRIAFRRIFVGIRFDLADFCKFLKIRDTITEANHGTPSGVVIARLGNMVTGWGAPMGQGQGGRLRSKLNGKWRKIPIPQKL
ncbi:hypothetical protein C0J52_07203 [Blattella germanica]|nr:hypothetical protein C0J52_07203 [Blattella germanica]